MNAIEGHINTLLAQPGLAPETVHLLELAKEANQSGRMPEIPREAHGEWLKCDSCGHVAFYTCLGLCFGCDARNTTSMDWASDDEVKLFTIINENQSEQAQ